MIRNVPWWGGWRMLLRINGQLQAASSSAPPAVGITISPSLESAEKHSESDMLVNTLVKPVLSVKEPHITPPVPKKAENKPDLKSELSSLNNDKLSTEKDSSSMKLKTSEKGKRSTMVATAFASLQNVELTTRKHRPSLDDRISSADTVESLLSAAQSPQVARHHALRIVSILADWAASKRIKLVDFESDPRFVRLCRLLGRHSKSSSDDATGLGDLATVLGVTGDDEAAKLVSSISLSQMIRVMTSLAQKKRRSTPLLRTLAANISSCQDVLDVKQTADVLYAMAVLNFPDEVLLERASADLCSYVMDNERSAVVGSILTSLGMMQYKDTVLLDALSEWVENNYSVCRVQDLVALLLTLAKVNHIPANNDRLFEVILPQITEADVPRPAAWLDVVWALAVLGRADHSHLSSVLSPDAIAKLSVTNGNGILPAKKLKLLNLNGVAQLSTPGYKGPLLPTDSEDWQVKLVRSREKQLLVSSVLDSLSNLLSSSTYLQTNIDSGMGFLIDGECLMDYKCNPLPVKEESKTKRTDNRKVTRVAILVWDYHDMCRGRQEPAGAAVLRAQLLDRKGYQVLAVPYTEYNPREKVVARVQYLEQRLKALVSST